MNICKPIIIISLLALITVGCSKYDSGITQTEDSSTIIKKSNKRGLAYNLTNAADFDTLQSDVSWWYNWYYKTDASMDYYNSYQMKFIPMLWGNNSYNDFSEIKNFIIEHKEIEYLLVLTEPNLTYQANLSPYQAEQMS